MEKIKTITLSACAFLALAIISSCSSAHVPYKEARNYFFSNKAVAPDNPKIVSRSHFDHLFGMATTMGENGRPTDIDFTRQFVIAVVDSVTDINTELKPVSLVKGSSALTFTYERKLGAKMSWSMRPILLIVVDKKYDTEEINTIKLNPLTR